MSTNDADLAIEKKNTYKPKIYASQADLDPKDHPMIELRDWCQKQGDIVVLNSGLILVLDVTSRSVQNCRIMMANKGLRASKVVPASQELIAMLLSNVDDDRAQMVDPDMVSLQQQRLRMLVREAMLAQASDIHIEVRGDVAHVKFRRHGELYLHAEWVPKVGREIASVAFNKETDHAITHFNPNVPQSASMPMHIDDIEVRLRLASMPAHGGFDMVMRILSLGDDQVPTLAELGYTEEQIRLIEKAAQCPHGAVLVAGPTGSGKTTTLASCLQKIPGYRKIYTIEDPVEKVIHHATQVPVNTERDDRDFAAMGRAALRMDPDVMVLGEMRDSDTAHVLVSAAITGHLVFSTIHTSSATNIVTRLIDLGISPFLLGDNQLLVCLLFQRLLPKLCQHCSHPISPNVIPQADYQRFANYFTNDINKIRTRGTSDCDHCRETRIVGRTVAAEAIWVDAEGRRFIQKGDTFGWETYLRSQGWQSCLDHAIKLVRQGLVCPLDVEKIVGEISLSVTENVYHYVKD